MIRIHGCANLYLRPTGEAGIDRFAIKGGSWTIPDTETDFLDEGPPKKIYGVEKPLNFMSLDDFKKKADIFKAASESNREGFSNMVAMLENEKTFDEQDRRTLRGANAKGTT